MDKLEHIGIAVQDLEKAGELFTRLLVRPPYKTEEVPGQAVATMFFDVGNVKIELLQPTDPLSPVQQFLEKRGEGIHHIAFSTTDAEGEASRLRSEGFRLLYAKAQPGADDKLINFLHPKDTHGVLVEFCQDKPEQ